MAQIIVCASQHRCIGPCGLSRSSRAAEAEGSLHTRDSPSYFVFLSFFRIMSPVKDNVGRGLNIALVNGELLIHPPGSPHCGGVHLVSQHGLRTFHCPAWVSSSVKTGAWLACGNRRMKDQVTPQSSQAPACVPVPEGHASPWGLYQHP